MNFLNYRSFSIPFEKNQGRKERNKLGDFHHENVRAHILLKKVLNSTIHPQNGKRFQFLSPKFFYNYDLKKKLKFLEFVISEPQMTFDLK